MKNLNELKIKMDSSYTEISDHGISNGHVTALFKNIEDELIKFISMSNLIVGCVAWLTSYRVLDALSRVPGGVSLVVQKEDFLRPDIGVKGPWKLDLRKRYEAIKCLPERHTLGGLVGQLSVCNDPIIEPIRCVGNFNSEKKPAFPRMHNKFIVSCNLNPTKNYEVYDSITPVSVWTGSFNFTANAAMSLENAVIIQNPEIAMAYYREWESILALSEELNWASEWVDPQWRIGT